LFLQVCVFYMQNGRCDYVRECRNHHPNIRAIDPDRIIAPPKGTPVRAGDVLADYLRS
jgi:hypothetical protein